MPRPACAKCSREMEPLKNGVVVEFQARTAKPAPAVNLSQSAQGPYQQWLGDLFGCAGCGARIVANYGDRPAWTHFAGEVEPGYQPPTVVITER